MQLTKKQTDILRRSIAVLAVLPMAAAVQSAYAQNASTQPAAEEAQSKVVVTARRREELIQDVPGAVSAISASQLDKKAIPDITALTDFVPNTTLKASRGTNTTLTAFIRGVGQQDPVAGYEQGVGIYLDDVYLARPQGALTDIYDLERIEVLRGPQGTLYGRNTIGGAVKYVTRKLSNKPSLDTKLTIGNYGAKDLVVKGSVPVSDMLRIGATVGTFNRDGFGKNVINGRENYNKDVMAGRFSAELTPTPEMFVRFTADKTVDESEPKQGHRLTAGPAPTNYPVLGGEYDTRANLYKVNGKDQKVTTEGASLLLSYDLSPQLSFKSITAHRSSESIAPIDFDSLDTPLFEAPAIYTDKQTSQEFQLTFNTNSWQGVAGVFFMKTNAFNEFDVLYNAAGGLSLYTLDDIDTKTWAAFADASYNLTDTFNVTVGGRFTEDERSARIYKRTYIGLQGSPTLGNPAAVGLAVNTDMSKNDLNRTDKKFTPKVGFGWKVAPEHNIYGTYSTGFKGGMYDPRMDLAGTGGPNTPASLQKRQGVNPEEVTTLEAGLKSSMNQGRVQTNVAVFYTDYKNVQIPGSIPTYNAAGAVTGFAGSLTNAGKAKISGLEVEGMARVTDQLTVSGMYSFIDAQYKEWMVANGPGLVNIAPMAEFQNTPKHSANLTVGYDWPMALGSSAGTMTLTSSLSYKGKVYQGEIVRLTGVASVDGAVPQNIMLAQSAYSLFDTSLVWTSADRRLQLGLHGRNLADKRYKVAGYAFGGFFNTITTYYGDPRTIKLTAAYKF